MMNDPKTAKQILAMLDDNKRRAFMIKLWAVIAIVIAAGIAASQWQSPLAIMPKTGLSFVLGALYIYLKSVAVYPKIAKYFDVEALENDANQIDPNAK